MTKATLLRQAREHLRQTRQGYHEYAKSGKGSAWRRAEALLDRLESELAEPSLGNLGPVLRGGASILEHDLTHATGGFPTPSDPHTVYPAFDDGFGYPGRSVIAPEALTVKKIGSAARRDGHSNGRSVYVTGASGLRYWFGHVEDPPAVGRKIPKGARLGVISANHEAPHVHVGIDASALLGRDLAHHTDYTHGAATVGAQLRRFLT